MIFAVRSVSGDGIPNLTPLPAKERAWAGPDGIGIYSLLILR